MLDRAASGLVLLLLAAGSAAGQSPKDTKGKATIGLNDGLSGTIELNPSDKSLAARYNWFDQNLSAALSLGVEGKSKNGLATILRTGALTPESKVTITGSLRTDEAQHPGAVACIAAIGVNIELAEDCVEIRTPAECRARLPNQYHAACPAYQGRAVVEQEWLFLEVGWTASEPNWFDPNAQPDSAVVGQRFDGISVLLGALRWEVAPGPRFAWGWSAGIERSNNLSELKAVEVSTTDTIGTTSAGALREVSESAVAAFAGDYDEFWQWPINADFFFAGTGASGIGSWTYGRLVFKDGHDTEAALGTGLFFFDSPDLYTARGAVAVEVRTGKGIALALYGALPFR